MHMNVAATCTSMCALTAEHRDRNAEKVREREEVRRASAMQRDKTTDGNDPQTPLTTLRVKPMAHLIKVPSISKDSSASGLPW